VKDVPAAVVAIAIAIGGVVDEDEVRAAVREVTVVATPVAADAEEGRMRVAS
jgi:predicted metal-dependent peptidase